MNALLAVLLVLIILLLLMMGVGLYALLRRQDHIQSHLSRSGEWARLEMDHLDKVMRKMDQLQIQGAKTSQTTSDLQEQMHSITQVMSNAKRRGSWGEYQLESLVRTYLGDSLQIYEAQYRLDNGTISDGAFHLPGTSQVLCIDSKFPMENYLNMVNEPDSVGFYEKEFRRNIKKHINDVAHKYITPQTLDEAVLFIPSEAVYQYLCSDGADLMNYAMSQHVLLVSPTTLAGVVFSLQASTRNFYRAQNFREIEKQLQTIEQEASRLQDRCMKAQKSSAALNNHLNDLTRDSQRLLDALHKCEMSSLDAQSKD